MDRGETPKFVWSDAWILHAIVLASSSGNGTLAEIIAAADAVNHAIPCDDEMHGALCRLTQAGWVTETDLCFIPTPEVPQRLRRSNDYRRFLRAAEWTPATATRQPENQNLEYPGLGADGIARAVEEYQRRARTPPNKK